jgi:uncharacterized membrane protein
MVAIGAGFIILAVVWILAFIICIVFSRSQGPLAYVGIIVILAAVVLTLVLWFYPRGPQTSQPYIVYDYTYISRTVIVSICGIMLFFGILAAVFFHIFDQRRGTPIKPWVY